MTLSKIISAELKKYYGEISKALVCDRKQKAEFLKEFKNNIDEYLATYPDADLEKIKSAFGTPEQIAESFLENSTSERIKKKLDIKKYILLALVAALLIYVAFIVISLIDVHTEAHGYIEEGVMMISAFKGGAVL